MGRSRSCLPGLCAIALLALGCSGSYEIQPPDRSRYNLSAMNAVYATMMATELSDLKSDLAQIIHERLMCYSENVMAFDRVRDCRKKYVRNIITLSRSRIKSAPRLGDAILCLQYCPISHAVCMGDNIDCDEADCIAAESKCIEYCLDRFWRGGTFPNGDMIR